MATYSSSNNGMNLDNVQNYADRTIRKKLNSALYQRLPIITFFTGKLSGESTLGRPGTYALIGGKSNFSQAERIDAAGESVHVRLQTQDSTVTGYIGAYGVSPTMGNAAQNRDRTTAYFKWTQPLASAIKVDGIIKRTSNNAKIANAIEEAGDQALQSHLSVMGLSLWRGNPSSQTDDEWDSPLGILQAIDTDNTYGNVTRNSASHYWSGNRVTGSVPASLNLITDANLGTDTCSSIGRPLNNYGPGADLWIASNAVYAKLRREALARGATLTTMSMPGIAEVGIQHECINYSGAKIIADPTLTGNWSAYDSDITDATKVLVGLTSEDWKFSVNSTDNFRVGPMTYQFDQRAGGDDAITGTLSTQFRLWCEKPHRQIVFTSVA